MDGRAFTVASRTTFSLPVPPATGRQKTGLASAGRSAGEHCLLLPLTFPSDSSGNTAVVLTLFPCPGGLLY